MLKCQLSETCRRTCTPKQLIWFGPIKITIKILPCLHLTPVWSNVTFLFLLLLQLNVSYIFLSPGFPAALMTPSHTDTWLPSNLLAACSLSFFLDALGFPTPEPSQIHSSAQGTNTLSCLGLLLFPNHFTYSVTSFVLSHLEYKVSEA